MYKMERHFLISPFVVSGDRDYVTAASCVSSLFLLFHYFILLHFVHQLHALQCGFVFHFPFFSHFDCVKPLRY